LKSCSKFFILLFLSLTSASVGFQSSAATSRSSRRPSRLRSSRCSSRLRYSRCPSRLREEKKKKY
jgi:hypothetical protein